MGALFVFEHKGWPCKIWESVWKKCGHTMIMRTFKTSRHNPIVYRKAQSPMASDKQRQNFLHLDARTPL